MKKGNISIFVPHKGCPCLCSFCNQKTITGKNVEPTSEDVDKAVQTALKYKQQNGKHNENKADGDSAVQYDLRETG